MSKSGILSRCEDKATRRQFSILLALVAFDAALKLLAFRLLPLDPPYRVCSLCLMLTVNTSGLGSGTAQVVERNGEASLFVAISFSTTLAVLLLILAEIDRLTTRPVIAVVSVSCAGSLLISALPVLTRIPLPLAAELSRAAATCLWLVVWFLAAPSLWRSGVLLLACAGVANSLSSVIAPYRVVDYLWSSPLHRIIGFGIFNFADILWLCAFPVFIAASVIGAWKLFARSRARRR